MCQWRSLVGCADADLRLDVDAHVAVGRDAQPDMDLVDNVVVMLQTTDAVEQDVGADPGGNVLLNGGGTDVAARPDDDIAC